MQRSDLCIMILTQDDTLTEKTAREAVMRLFTDPGIAPDVSIVRHEKKDRIQKLNAWFEHSFDRADRFVVLDAEQMPLEALPALAECFGKHPADIALFCDPAPKLQTFDAHRIRYARYLCEQSACLYFSEKAVKRMQTADTTELVEEALADRTLSAAYIPNALCGVHAHSCLSGRLHLLRCLFGIRRLLAGCAAACLIASLIFLLYYLPARSAIGLIGCIISVHLFLFSLAALLILWYRRSAKLEQKKREHLYVEESRTT